MLARQFIKRLSTIVRISKRRNNVSLLFFLMIFFKLIVQHLSDISSHNDDDLVGEGNLLLIAHYIRRKPKDYIRHWSKLIKSNGKVHLKNTLIHI